MKLKVNVKISEGQSLSAEMDGKLMECLRGLNPFLSYKGFCGKCNSKNIILQTRVAKGFTFPEFFCCDCYAKSSFGSYKEGGYFLKKWEVYQQNPPKEIDVDKVPF